MKEQRQMSEDNIRARGDPRDKPDLKKLSRALIALALEQAKAEADAEAEHKSGDEEDEPRAA